VGEFVGEHGVRIEDNRNAVETPPDSSREQTFNVVGVYHVE
jgi:hypothetical protein